MILTKCFGVGVSCCNLYSFVVYLYVNGSGSITSVGDCMLFFACGCVVSVWGGFLFLWVLGMGYVILFRHSLCLPYNYFGVLTLVVIPPAKRSFRGYTVFSLSVIL